VVGGIPTPSYDLLMVQRLVAGGSYLIRKSALNGAGELSFDRTDIKDCVLGLTVADFYKTMVAERVPGLMQDVYRPNYLGVELYVKLQIALQNQAIVISFKKR